MAAIGGAAGGGSGTSETGGGNLSDSILTTVTLREGLARCREKGGRTTGLAAWLSGDLAPAGLAAAGLTSVPGMACAGSPGMTDGPSAAVPSEAAAVVSGAFVSRG
jgi:hypothetical protein